MTMAVTMTMAMPTATKMRMLLNMMTFFDNNDGVDCDEVGGAGVLVPAVVPTVIMAIT